MAQVYACEISTYEVFLGRSSAGSGPDFGRSWVRNINLNLSPGRFGNGVVRAEIYFFDEPGHIDETKNGVRSDDTLLKLFVPVADFQDMYNILRSERPLTILWQQKDPGGVLTSINAWRITSSREPIAEGDSEV